MTGIVKGLDEIPEFQFVREAVLFARKWRAMVDTQLRPRGLTLARATLLYWLAELPEAVTQSELADIVGIEGPTLVRQLHALEAQGLIERVPVEGDRRAKAIRATPAAAPFVDTLRDVTGGMVEEYFGRLDRRRLASATKLLHDARQALE